MIPNVPYSEIKNVYGDPIDNGDFARLKRVRLPFPLRLSWKPETVINYTYTHPAIAQPTIDALSEILAFYGLSFIQEKELDRFGGCHNYRQVAGGSRLSVHAWGLALDYCPELGRLGYPPMTPHVIVRAFERVGFHWGGLFSRRDGMHFSGIDEWN